MRGSAISAGLAKGIPLDSGAAAEADDNVDPDDGT